METPAHLSRYSCADYFDSNLSADGCWSEDESLWLIVPSSEIEEISDCDGNPINFLQVGRPGVDSIAFGYRADHPGFWAYYPMEDDNLFLASTVQQFLDGWRSGEMTV